MTSREHLDAVRTQLDAARADFTRLRDSGAGIPTLNRQAEIVNRLYDEELRAYLAAVDEVRPPAIRRLTYRSKP